jgi:hypothetical protein
MPGRRNYEAAVRRAVDEIETLTGNCVLMYITRPGDGEAPRYVFVDRTCFGGREALDYAQGLLEDVKERMVSPDVA